MEIKSIEKDGYDPCLRIALEYLRAGRVVCFPTETFYALGVRYDDETALERVVKMKERPGSKAFSLMIGTGEVLGSVVSHVETLEEELMRAFWPGALTIVFSAKEGLSSLVKDDNNTVAVRMPDRSFALDLAVSIGVPLTATSANLSGMPPSRSADEVIDVLGSGLDLVIDGGSSTAEFPSTIVDARGGQITVLREGVIKRSDIISLVNK